jgi:hypothetical protein
MTWIGNPAQPKTYRSPWFQENKFPFGEGISNVQNKTNKRRLDQFGAMLSEEEKQQAVPGPLIRHQSYPGTPSPQNAKHESSSIFYNYEDQQFVNKGYKVAPYWRFGQWSYIYPEYLKLTCSQSAIGSILVFDDPDDGFPPTTLPIEVGIFNTGTFLLKQSSGYQWTSPNPLQSYNIATNPNTAWSVSYVPCYSVTSKSFPSRFCNWMLSFRPFYYGVPTTDDKGPISPYTWVLSCCDLGQLETINYVMIQPAPTTGTLRLRYGDTPDGFTGSTATWPTTGTLDDKVETFRTRIASSLSISADNVTVVSSSSASIIYEVHIPWSSYQVLTVHTNTLDASVSIEESTEGAYQVTSGQFNFFIPQAGFSKPNGSCKDTRDIGIFDRDYMTTLFPDEGSEFLPFGEEKSEHGLSHGNISFKKQSRWKIHTSLPIGFVNSDPSFFDYPGWQFPAIDFNPNQVDVFRYPFYEHNRFFSLTVEPIYL